MKKYQARPAVRPRKASSVPVVEPNPVQAAAVEVGEILDVLKKPVFILGFIAGYWRMIILFAVFVVVGKIDAVTYFVGPVFYLIQMLIGCQVAAAFAKHIFDRQSIDTYTQAKANEQGDTAFVLEWRGLTPSERVRLTTIKVSIYFLGAAYIAGNLAK